MVYNIALGISLIIAVVFSALIIITGKGDAMGGASGVRTSYKGKASFEDYMSKLTLVLGVSWMALMLIVDIIANRMPKH